MWHIQCAMAEHKCETGELKLTDDPQKATEINNIHRSAQISDGEGSGLWSLDQFCKLPRQMYGFSSPTLIPPKWNIADKIDQAVYDQRFAREFSDISGILPHANVVICGGAAAWPLKCKKKAGDIDFFLYGLPTDDSKSSREARWRCVESLLKKIRSKYEECSETLSAGLVTLKCSGNPDVKIQIILRAYKSISSILHGFDVPSCCVAYDGRQTYMTHMAAYAHAFSVNVVVPAYRSTTYESRLIKYYERGFAIAMPNLDIAKAGAEILLPNMAITDAVVVGNAITGNPKLIQEQPLSDYSPHMEHFATLRSIAARNFPPVMVMYAGEGYEGEHYSVLNNRDGEGLYPSAYTTKQTVISREQLERLVRKRASYIISKNNHAINTVFLKEVLCLTDEQIAMIACEVARVGPLLRDGAKLDLSSSFERSIGAFLAKYDDLPDDVEWWILTNPARQHTASLNPRCESPGQWYGEYFIKHKAPTNKLNDDTIQGLLRFLSAQNTFNCECCICMQPVSAGDPNTVTLACNHVFHWAVGNGCGGLIGWVKEKNDSCPLCRGKFCVAQKTTKIVRLAIHL